MRTPETAPLVRSQFPANFRFGTATASYQIEGSPDADGKGPSIWDTFTHTPGKVHGNETGDVACDHYVRMPDDVDRMADLGVNAYRFSVSWPRVLPGGVGSVETRGLDFYDRLVDRLLSKNIAPALTLYHWDLPQALEDGGGWLSRDTAYAFADYAVVVADRLADRLDVLITLNEPVVSALFGYGLGMHAPGKVLMLGSFPATHHLLLGHGLAMQALRSAHPTLRTAITLNLSPVEAFDAASADDELARSKCDALQNRTYLDPVLLGRYPDVDLGYDFGCVQDGDLELISSPLDLLGINYYNPTRVRAPGPGNPLPFEFVDMTEYEFTATDWPVVPDGLRRLLVGLKADYPDALPPIAITENGSAFDDVVVDGRVDDPARREYLEQHLAAVRDAMAEGVDIIGYYCWSFLDNFEWAEGYSKRFGLVYVDYPTQQRIEKSSANWYREFLGHPS